MPTCDNENDIDAKPIQQQPADERPKALTLIEAATLLASLRISRGERDYTKEEAFLLLDFVEAFKVQCDHWRDVFNGRTGIDIVDGQIYFIDQIKSQAAAQQAAG